LVLDRHDLTVVEWARLEPLLPDRTPRRGGRWADHRQIVNGVFWRTRCGLPWRDLPTQYGCWKTVYNRHRRWSGDGTWERILDELRRDTDVSQGPDWAARSTVQSCARINTQPVPGTHHRSTSIRRSCSPP
jgi:transposase